MKKPKVLCICSMGINRSKYLANYLKNKGYRTRYGGIGFGIIHEKAHNPFKQEDIDWAEVIIVVRKKHKPLLKKHYKVKGKRIIVLDVTDSRKIIGGKYSHLNNLDHPTFNRMWTYPQLRKAIKPYLPLKINNVF
ncbi:hypothetical protein J4466_01575 [Candidatus Pacearchaeota archaeon]|nr:hypothetical protein [Candidatus Pacearchaeota archaeon]